MAAHPVSNADVIKHGTPRSVVRRYGRIAGYEREFEKRGSLAGLLNVDSRVTETRTVTGAHGAFVYLKAHPSVQKGVRFRRATFPVGAESYCYSYEVRRSGTDFHGFACLWRQGRLLGQLSGVGLAGKPIRAPFKQALAKQAGRMATF